MTDLATGKPPGAPDDWVPVEHRFAGLDRRTIAPALFVLALAFICATVLPAIDAAIEPDNPVKAGDVMNLGGGLTFVPAEGWNVVKGLRVSDRTNSPATESAPPVVLTNGSVVLHVTVGPFSGDANQLLDQTNKLETEYGDIAQLATTSERVSVTTRQGTTGVVETFTGSEVQGKIAAFVIDGTGIQIVAYGLPDDLATHDNDISDMVESIATTGGQP